MPVLYRSPANKPTRRDALPVKAEASKLSRCHLYGATDANHDDGLCQDMSLAGPVNIQTIAMIDLNAVTRGTPHGCIAGILQGESTMGNIKRAKTST